MKLPSKVVTNPLGNIPSKPKSHVRGWSEHWANQLDAHIDYKGDMLQYADVIYLDHGVNFDGAINLFGGLDEKTFNKVNLIAELKSSGRSVVSLDHAMPRYGELFAKRIGNKTTHEAVTKEWCDWLTDEFSDVETLNQSDMNLEGVTFGDSHSTAYANSLDRVFRKNGRTLFGVLKEGLHINNAIKIYRLNIALGSIDIRHHVLRGESTMSPRELAVELVKQGDKFASKEKCTVEYSFAVPVEHEERKLPKTGYYKGTPFFGSREARLGATLMFNEHLYKASGGRIVAPPEDWYLMDPKAYADEIMEMGGSVHIAPTHYRRVDWGLS